MQDDFTYGFSRSDAVAIKSMVETAETEHAARIPRDDPAGASDTLETFQMTSNWIGGIATATFTNLSEPAYGNSAGILEDPEGIFVDVLGAGGRGLSIRTRYGRHYVIQAKCAQTLTPPENTGACEVYIEGEGVACVITTEATCDAVGGTFDGVGTTCP